MTLYVFNGNKFSISLSLNIQKAFSFLAGNAIRTRDFLVGNEMLYHWAMPALNLYFFIQNK